MTEARCGEAVMACVASYRKFVRFLANQPLLSRSFQRVNVDQLDTTVKEKSQQYVVFQLVHVHPLKRARQQWLVRKEADELSVRGDARHHRFAASRSVMPFWRPAIQRLTTSRRRSHSHGPGCASSKSFRSITRSRSGEA